MSATANCACPCPTPEVVEVPGGPGENGAPGAAGTNGVSVFTVTTGDAVFANAIDTVQVSVENNVMFAIGQTVFGADPTGGTDHGTFEVISLTGTTVIGLRATDAPGDTALPFTIGSGGKITATGATGALAGALPAAITDNSTGTASDIVSAGVGKFVHSIFFDAVAITGNVLLYTYTPGFAFKILRISASIVSAITTGARAATLTTAIAGTPTTGGVVTVAGAYALGDEQASSAAITAANTGTNVQAVTVIASAVTAFAEGGFMLHLEIQNMDTANAIASLADHVNDLITALT